LGLLFRGQWCSGLFHRELQRSKSASLLDLVVQVFLECGLLIRLQSSRDLNHQIIIDFLQLGSRRSIGKLSEARTSGLTATGIGTASPTAALTTLAATAALTTLTALPTLRGNAITDVTNLLNRRFNRGSQRLLLIAGERDVGF